MKSKIGVLCLLMLSACASQPENPDTYQPFSVRKFNVSNEDRAIFTMVKSEYERTRKLDSRALTPVLRTNPEAAKFFIEKTSNSLDKHTFFLRQNALRTLLISGEFKPYLTTYWGALIGQRKRAHPQTFYELRTIIPATEWVARNDSDPAMRAFAFGQLINHYYHGCTENSYEFSDDKPEDVIMKKVFGNCNPRENKMQEYYRELSSDNNINGNIKFIITYETAEKYLAKKEYDKAGKWYLEARKYPADRNYENDVNDKINMIEYKVGNISPII